MRGVHRAYRKYVKAFGAHMGIDEFTRLFFEQVEGSKAKIPKAMEDAFCEPSSDAVMRDKGVRRPVQCRTSDEAAWRLHNSLRELIQSLKSIDDPPPGENASAQRAKSAAFALVSLTLTSVAFAEYVRVDKTRAAPVLDDATLRVASVSLAKMAPALA